MVAKIQPAKKTRPNLYNKANIISNKITSKTQNMGSSLYNNSNKLYNGFGNISNYYKIIVSVFIAIAIFIVGAYAIVSGYKFIRNASIFNIEKINISGNKHLTNSDILNIIELQKGTNIFDIEIQTIRKELLEHNWTEEVTIRRSLPSTISINIIERKPVFWAIKDENLYYIDSKASFISPVINDKFVSLPMLNIANANKKALEILPEVINSLSNKDLSFSLEKLSWVTISERNDFILYQERLQKTFIIDINDWKRNIQHLQITIDDLKKRNEFSRIGSLHAIRNQVNVIKPNSLGNNSKLF